MSPFIMSNPFVMFDVIRNFKAALQYANYDFYKLKKEIIDLILKGREQGLDNPDYCKLTIKNSSIGRDYPVFIDLYYKKNNNECIHLPQELLIGSFITMPSSIRAGLSNDGFVEIKINNLTELSISSSECVSKPIEFESISAFGSTTHPLTSRVITIKDEVFAYRVIYKFDSPDKRDQIKAITYADIIGIPEDIAIKLKSDGQCSIKLD